ncbi:MAG: hypothetical protein AB7S80_14760 [Rhizobiaceae bacterium]
MILNAVSAAFLFVVAGSMVNPSDNLWQSPIHAAMRAIGILMVAYPAVVLCLEVIQP